MCVIWLIQIRFFEIEQINQKYKQRFGIKAMDKKNKKKESTKPMEQLFHPKELTRVRNVKKKYDSSYVYACNACPRRFKQKKILNFHIRTMLRKKFFQCDLCLEKYFRKYHLSRHLVNGCPARKSTTKTKQTNKFKNCSIDAHTNTRDKSFSDDDTFLHHDNTVEELQCGKLKENNEVEKVTMNIIADIATDTTETFDKCAAYFPDDNFLLYDDNVVKLKSGVTLKFNPMYTNVTEKSTQTDERLTAERKIVRDRKHKRKVECDDRINLRTKKMKEPLRDIVVIEGMREGNFENFNNDGYTGIRTKAQRKYFVMPRQISETNDDNADEIIVPENATVEEMITETNNEQPSFKLVQPSEEVATNTWNMICNSLNEVASEEKTPALGNFVVDDVIIGNEKYIEETTNEIPDMLRMVNQISNKESPLRNRCGISDLRHKPESAIATGQLNERLRSDIIEGRKPKCVIADATFRQNCPFCDIKVATNAYGWTDHFKRHTGEFHLTIKTEQQNGVMYGFICPGCYLVTLSKQNMVEHVRNKHKINGDLRHAHIKFELMRSADIAPNKNEMEATICDQPDVFSLSEDREEGEISNDEDDRRNETSWTVDRKHAVNFAAMEISGNSTIAGEPSWNDKAEKQGELFDSRHGIRPYLKNGTLHFEVQFSV